MSTYTPENLVYDLYIARDTKTRLSWYTHCSRFTVHYNFEHGQPFGSFMDVKESFTAKQKDRLTSFLMLNVLEAEIFQ